MQKNKKQQQKNKDGWTKVVQNVVLLAGFFCIMY